MSGKHTAISFRQKEKENFRKVQDVMGFLHQELRVVSRIRRDAKGWDYALVERELSKAEKSAIRKKFEDIAIEEVEACPC